MPRIADRLLFILSLALLVCAVHAQVGVAVSGGPDHTSPPHQFQPYTAEFKITHVQTLADGTTITSEGTEIRARDSAGITMQSNTDQDWHIGRMLGTSAGVHDTDGTILANWYSVTKAGHVFKMPPKEQRHGCWISASVRMEWNDRPPAGPPPNKYVFDSVTRTVEQVPAPIQRSRPKIDEIGSISIQGVEAHGQRITRTISMGEAGNDHTIVTVEEDWMAPSLGLMLRESIDDPRIGKRTRELISLTLGEPDPSLFQPPADYAVTTEELHAIACHDPAGSVSQPAPASSK
ncbi:MAG TPA: hypothetical protein VGG62_07790 [Terracidiphilus sp.]|jgi:hypothetical protein